MNQKHNPSIRPVTSAIRLIERLGMQGWNAGSIPWVLDRDGYRRGDGCVWEVKDVQIVLRWHRRDIEAARQRWEEVIERRRTRGKKKKKKKSRLPIAPELEQLLPAGAEKKIETISPILSEVLRKVRPQMHEADARRIAGEAAHEIVLCRQYFNLRYTIDSDSGIDASAAIRVIAEHQEIDVEGVAHGATSFHVLFGRSRLWPNQDR